MLLIISKFKSIFLNQIIILNQKLIFIVNPELYEEATFYILHEMHDENTTLTDLKKKFSIFTEVGKKYTC